MAFPRDLQRKTLVIPTKDEKSNIIFNPTLQELIKMAGFSPAVFSRDRKPTITLLNGLLDPRRQIGHNSQGG